MRLFTVTLTLVAFLFSFNSSAQSFQKQTIAADKSISDITMVNALTGYAGGVDGIYKTTDGGQHWDLLPFFVTTGDWSKDYIPGNFNVVHLHFSNELEGIAYGWHSYNYEIIMATKDGGVTWTLKHFAIPPITNSYFNQLNS